MWVTTNSCKGKTTGDRVERRCQLAIRALFVLYVGAPLSSVFGVNVLLLISFTVVVAARAMQK